MLIDLEMICQLILIDTLYELKNDSNKYVIHDRFDFGFRYEEIENKFWICDKNTGYYESTTNILASYLFDEGWQIKKVVNPKYKIGDRFLMPGFTILGTDKDIKYLNVVAIITDCICDNGHVKYNLYTNGITNDLLLDEKELEKYDMVNMQVGVR